MNNDLLALANKVRNASLQAFDSPELKQEIIAALEAAKAQPVVAQSVFRDLLLEWEGMEYDNLDFLRRVRLALHGPLAAPAPAVEPKQP